jgi:DNA transformation protein and related proteins
MSSKATADHSAEQLLSSLGPIKQRAMFGGYGLYAEGVIIGLVVFDRLFLKTDTVSRPHFIAAACLPFTYEGKGKTVVVNYYEPPADAFDSSAAMQPWARLAVEAALRSANAKPKRASAVRSAKKPAKSAK